MKHPFKTLIASAAAVAVVFAAGTASAQTKAEGKCHQTIAKNITKYQATLAKNQIGCHKSRTGGKIGAIVNCNLAKGANSADQKGKIAGARQKAIDGINKACTLADPMLTAAVLAEYVACPSPVAASISNFTDVATCLLNLSENYIDKIGAELMGNPTMPLTGDANAVKAKVACQGGIGKAWSKAVKTIGGSRAKCQAGVEKAAGGLEYTAACSVSDPSGKIAPAIQALNDAVDACGSVISTSAEELGFCAARNASPTPALHKACGVTKVAVPVANGLAGAAQELDGTCASQADVVINAGYGIKPSNSRLDSGWKGSAHHVDVIDQSFGAVTLSNCDLDCRNCDVTHNPKNGNCRCENDATIECTTINGADPACGGNDCQCMFGPPLAISASATPVCVVNRFASDFSGGTAEVGEYQVTTVTRALVHTGISQVQPCPICVSNTCEGGARDGLSCTVNATHPDFGPVSYDCPPDSGANISGSGLLLDLEFSSGSASVSATIPAAGTFCDGANDCHCSVCTGDSKIGCNDDAPCIAASAGTCGVALANNPKQNDCTSSCTDDGNGNGTCDGPIEQFCGQFLRGNGNGIITCSVDADCDANDCDGDGMLTENECGDCDASGFRQCFLPTVSATGTPGIFNSEGISVFCSGQTGNAGVDNAGGLPGPGRVKLDFDFNLYCANGAPYQLPGGPTCP